MSSSARRLPPGDRMTKVRIPPTLREETRGQREVEVEGATVRELLDDLATRFPALGRQLLENGSVAPFVNVYVENEDIRTLNGLETPVREGSSVVLLPAMAGGSLTSLVGVSCRSAKPTFGDA
jgi:sulfur-carrier protein